MGGLGEVDWRMVVPGLACILTVGRGLIDGTSSRTDVATMFVPDAGPPVVGGTVVV